MKSIAFTLILLLIAGPFAFARERSGVASRRLSVGQKSIFVDPWGDTVFPHVVAGPSWKTTFILVNLDDKDAPFELHFMGDNGEPLLLSIVGEPEPTSVISRTIPVNGSVTIETADRSDDIWGAAFLVSWRMENGNRIQYFISGMAVYRQRIEGRPDFEATVFLSPFDENDLTIPFDNRFLDNRQFSTGIALTLSSMQESGNIPIAFSVYDHEGNVVTNDLFEMPANGHTAFNLFYDDRFAATRGISGTIRFMPANFDADPLLSGLGLRFNPDGAFTSLPSLSLSPFALVPPWLR